MILEARLACFVTLLRMPEMPPLDSVDLTSDCFRHFGHSNFDPSCVPSSKWEQCPIEKCSAHLVDVAFGKSSKPYCSAHGLRLHSKTFVYWNGESRVNEARLRNFRIRPELAAKLALGSSGKVESHRLGYEMSEDALSWNVFVGLAEAGKLRETTHFLTGRVLQSEPVLYLWGKRIDLTGKETGRFTPLNAARVILERGIGTYKTEPDIMLVADGELIVCVEAKFGSGNPVAHEGSIKPDEKPTSREGLLERYLNQSSARTKAAIVSEQIGNEFHSQLFRNVVFASEMADESDWHVVNLASSTQWKQARVAKGYSYSNPEDSVRCYLSKNHKDCFSYRTWENLHRALIRNDPALRELDAYLRSKSAHFRPAFELG
ncbi:MAG TPA: hypothetical protein VES88_11440 [Gemmatimonadaceae bacterium]|nr:hypothetical protein [Gemmatimonadaceae bacterium]